MNMPDENLPITPGSRVDYRALGSGNITVGRATGHEAGDTIQVEILVPTLVMVKRDRIVEVSPPEPLETSPTGKRRATSHNHPSSGWIEDGPRNTRLYRWSVGRRRKRSITLDSYQEETFVHLLTVRRLPVERIKICIQQFRSNQEEVMDLLMNANILTMEQVRSILAAGDASETVEQLKLLQTQS